MITFEDLDDLCTYLNERVVPPTDEGPHCDGTPKFVLEYLWRAGRGNELHDYLTTGQGRCDCALLSNFPGLFYEGDSPAIPHVDASEVM
jgi:hypothetical protein